MVGRAPSARTVRGVSVNCLATGLRWTFLRGAPYSAPPSGPGPVAPPDPAADWQPLLDAYDRIRPLSNEERRLIGILERSGAVVAALFWLRRLHGAAALPIAVIDTQRTRDSE